MTKCNIPPPGWVCSREPGHEGPCAARRETPYDEYADKAVYDPGMLWDSNVSYVGKEMVYSEAVRVITMREFRQAIIDAWMAGLAHSLEMIEIKQSV